MNWLVVILIIVILEIYFLPYSIARKRQRRDKFWVFWINLFIGWTILGWLGCLVWVGQDDE